MQQQKLRVFGVEGPGPHHPHPYAWLQAKCQQSEHAARGDPCFPGQRQALWDAAGTDRLGAGEGRAHPAQGCGSGHPAASGSSCKMERLVRLKHSEGQSAAPWVPGWVWKPLCHSPGAAAPTTSTLTCLGCLSPLFIPQISFKN